MPNISVSVTHDLYTMMKAKAISPSKVFQMGLSMIEKYGGIDNVDSILSDNKLKDQEMEDIGEINKALKERIDNLRDEIEYLRKTYILDDKKEKAKTNKKIKQEENAIDKAIKESVKPPEE